MFGSLLKLAVDIVKLLVSAVKDVIVPEEDKSRTVDNVEDIGDDILDVFDFDI